MYVQVRYVRSSLDAIPLHASRYCPPFQIFDGVVVRVDAIYPSACQDAERIDVFAHINLGTIIRLAVRSEIAVEHFKAGVIADDRGFPRLQSSWRQSVGHYLVYL